MNKDLIVSRNQRRSESGVTLVIVTFFMVALFAFAALSIDVSNVLREQRKAQIGTDAAALAAAALLTNTSDSVVIAEAQVIAASNGVTAEEIAAGAHGGYPGQIQIGNWDPTRNATNRFLAGGTPRNAVRVPARRTVNLYFAKVVGPSQMTPAVHSIAYIPPSGLVPFGMSQTEISLLGGTNCVSDTDTNCQLIASSTDPGNWGKLDLGGGLTKNPNDWVDAFVNGYTGPIGPSTVVNGQTLFDVSTDPGFAHLIEAWDARKAINPIVIMPVILDTFPNGRKDVFIYEFAVVKLLNQSSQGSNWQGTIQVLSIVTDPNSVISVNSRTLVE